MISLPDWTPLVTAFFQILTPISVAYTARQLVRLRHELTEELVRQTEQLERNEPSRK